jgi:hypothetical protein
VYAVIAKRISAPDRDSLPRQVRGVRDARMTSQRMSGCWCAWSSRGGGKADVATPWRTEGHGRPQVLAPAQSSSFR